MNAQELSNEILNQMETEKVIQFCKDPVMFSAVKKYILAVAYRHGVVEKGIDPKPTMNAALKMSWGAIGAHEHPALNLPRTDEELGQNIRALAQGVFLIESGFKEMSELNVPATEEKEPVNEAE